MEENNKNEKISVAERRRKVAQLIAQGVKDIHIREHFNISRRTFYRDVAFLHEFHSDEPAKNYAIIQSIEVRLELLRKMMLIGKTAKRDEDAIYAYSVANKMLNGLVHIYERLGLIPNVPRDGPGVLYRRENDIADIKAIKEKVLLDAKTHQKQ